LKIMTKKAKTYRTVCSAKGKAVVIYAALLAIAPPAQAFWPFSATKENPFAGKAFITERQEDQYTGMDTYGGPLMGDSFEFYLFSTPETVTTGRGVFQMRNRRQWGQWFPVAHIADERDRGYSVDHASKTLTLDSEEGYVYEVNGKVVTLKNMARKKTLYEVDKPFFLTDKTSIFWSGDQQKKPSFPDAMNYDEKRKATMQIAANTVQHHRTYIDNLIARAKGAPEIQLPEGPSKSQVPIAATVVNPDPSPAPAVATAAASAVAVASNPTPGSAPARSDGTGDAQSELTADHLVNGEYQGTLKDTGDGSQWKFEMRLGSLGEPTGQPPIASIKAMMKFEGVETEEMLIGAAVYSGETQLIMAGNSPRGTMTLKCRLAGDRLSGTLDSKGADGQTTAGTLEAARTGP
jgi:hypothetical protein